MNAADPPVPAQFECEHCRKRFTWNPANVGRQFRCRCGAVSVYPSAPELLEDGYALASDSGTIADAPVATPKPIAIAPKSVALGNAIPSKATSGKDTETIKNFYMPIWLLGGGVLVEIVSAWFRSSTLTAALATVGVQVIASTVLMLAGIILAAKLRQLDLGSFWIAVFKLAAIAVAPSAAFDLAYPALSRIPFAPLLGLAGEFILYFALLGALFDLDESDTWFCVWIIFLIRVGFYFLALFVLAR